MQAKVEVTSSNAQADETKLSGTRTADEDPGVDQPVMMTRLTVQQEKVTTNLTKTIKSPEVAMDSPPMAALPSLRAHRGRNSTLSRPGAFRAAGPAGHDEDNHDLSLQFGVDAQDIENSDLAVANAIESEQFHLPQASEFPQDRPKEPQATNRNKTIVFLLVLIIIAAIGLGIAFAIGSKKDDPQVEAFRKKPSNDTTFTAKQKRLLSLLPQDSVRAATASSTSPQALALAWLQQDPTPTDYYSNDRLLQRYALATLFHATSGNDTWVSKQNWLDHKIPECQWYTKADFAMISTFSTFYDGYFQTFVPPRDGPCDENDLLQHLWLDSNNLDGSIPDELYLMTWLKTLSFGYNKLQGYINPKIKSLASLEGLYLNNVGSGGTIPSQIGLLTHLKYLSLYQNSHSGTFPTEFWRLTNLDTFVLGLNSLELQGSISTEIGNMSNLKWFIVDNCGFAGTYGRSVGSSCGAFFFCTINVSHRSAKRHYSYRDGYPERAGVLWHGLWRRWHGQYGGPNPISARLVVESNLLESVGCHARRDTS